MWLLVLLLLLLLMLMLLSSANGVQTNPKGNSQLCSRPRAGGHLREENIMPLLLTPSPPNDDDDDDGAKSDAMELWNLLAPLSVKVGCVRQH